MGKVGLKCGTSYVLFNPVDKNDCYLFQIFWQVIYIRLNQ